MKIVSNFIEKINNNNNISICIIGDSVLDEYYDVKVTRISPESPNNCVELSSTFDPTEILPGGASNVLYQLKYFNNINLNLISFVDKDALSIFNKFDMFLDLIILPDGCFIPRKRRKFDGDIQVGNRWDIEKKLYGLTESQIVLLQKEITRIFSTLSPNVVILSDYNKGIFHKEVPITKKDSYTVIVDPKDHPISKWKDKCDIFKPNSTEAVKLSDGLTDWKQQCDFFQKELNCHSVVITQEGAGVVGKSYSEYFQHSPKNSIVAAKISGAGDFYVGVLAAAIAYGFSVKDAAMIGFECGSVYVREKSREPIKPWQLHKQSKFLPIEELVKRDYKLVMTNGCYDILHSGHLESLRFAKSKGDKLLVAVNSDESIRRLKGPQRPVNNLKERMEMLASLEVVDFVVSFEEDSPIETIKFIKPDVLVKGEDWKNKGGIVGSDLVKEVYYCPLVEDKSTTNIIDKIQNFKL